MKNHNTDWANVRTADAAGTAVSYTPESDLYDPNDKTVARAFWHAAKNQALAVRPLRSSVRL